MFTTRDKRIVARVAGMVGAIAIALSVPLVASATTAAADDVICPKGMHNDPYIGCVPD